MSDDLHAPDPTRRALLKGALSAVPTAFAGCGGGELVDAAPSRAEPTASIQAVRPTPVPKPTVPNPSVPGGVWQQMTVSTHSRKVLSKAGTGSTLFSTVFAEQVDAMLPKPVAAVPWRSFCRPVMGEPGVLYYAGSLHSNYPGNEIDRIDLRDLSSTVAVTQINHQPRVPPEGADSGYGAGSSNYVYAMYGVPLPDGALWQPYAHHTWTKNGWHPTWGWFSQVAYAAGNGATLGASPIGVGTRYQVSSGKQGLVSYGWTSGRYDVRLADAPGQSGASDWNQHRFSLIFLQTDSASRVSVKELVDTRTAATDLFTFDSAALSGNTWGFAANASGNGILLKWLEGSRYLGLRADFNKYSGDPSRFSAYHTLFLLNLVDSTSKVRRLEVPASALAGTTVAPDGNLTFCVDRNSRRIFWLIYSADSSANAREFVRFYVSTFDAPESWTEISTTGLPDIVNRSTQGAWLASKRETFWFYNGFLFLILPDGGGPSDPGYVNGAINLWRMKVDASEVPPTFNFKRLDYWAQNPATNGFRFSNTSVAPLQMIGTKHVNWAFRPTDGLYYQHAGDFGMSTCQSMCTLRFDASSHGYQFTETLNEDSNAPAGKVRPASPDDGHWFYVPTSSPATTHRDKFIWMRGGDGEPMFYNAVLRAKYRATDPNGTSQQVAQATADGWDIASKFYVFDPVSRSFDKIDGTGWTQDNGGIYWPSVWTASSASSRNGAYDPSTGCLWRFYNFGSQALARFDFVNKTVKVFNVSSWVSPETGKRIFMDGLPPPNEALLIADGSKPKFCWYDSAAQRHRSFGEFSWEHKATWLDPRDGALYVVSPGTGYLWRFETRGAHTSTGGDGWKLPFAPVGERIALVGTYPPLRSLDTWPPKVYNGDVRMNSLLLPFKGGLLYLSSNHHDSGVSGEPHYAMWRRLGSTGPWSVVTMPIEFAANTGAARSAYSIDNDELLAISQAWTDLDARQFYRYFWRIT